MHFGFLARAVPCFFGAVAMALLAMVVLGPTASSAGELIVTRDVARIGTAPAVPREPFTVETGPAVEVPTGDTLAAAVIGGTSSSTVLSDLEAATITSAISAESIAGTVTEGLGNQVVDATGLRSGALTNGGASTLQGLGTRIASSVGGVGGTARIATAGIAGTVVGALNAGSQ